MRTLTLTEVLRALTCDWLQKTPNFNRLQMVSLSLNTYSLMEQCYQHVGIKRMLIYLSKCFIHFYVIIDLHSNNLALLIKASNSKMISVTPVLNSLNCNQCVSTHLSAKFWSIYTAQSHLNSWKNTVFLSCASHFFLKKTLQKYKSWYTLNNLVIKWGYSYLALKLQADDTRTKGFYKRLYCCYGKFNC